MFQSLLRISHCLSQSGYITFYLIRADLNYGNKWDFERESPKENTSKECGSSSQRNSCENLDHRSPHLTESWTEKSREKLVKSTFQEMVTGTVASVNLIASSCDSWAEFCSKILRGGSMGSETSRAYRKWKWPWKIWWVNCVMRRKLLERSWKLCIGSECGDNVSVLR